MRPETALDPSRLAARAATLEERLAGCVVPAGAADGALVEGRLRRWRDRLGGGDPAALERRLALVGWNVERVTPLLGPVQIAGPTPTWCGVIADALALPAADGDPLTPLVDVARARLRGRPGHPSTRLAPEAGEDLERWLRTRLETLARPLLRLKRGIAATRRIGGEPGIELSLGELGAEHPVLLRLLARAVESWVDATSELLERLDRDAPVLTAALGVRDPTVQRVRTALSDPHDGGRCVHELRFGCGASLFYKPRPLDAEAAFAGFLRALPPGSPLGGAPRPELALRGDHGWMQAVAADEPSASDGAAYHRRCGGLLAVAELLRATDLQSGNVVRCAAHPVPIDLEAVCQPLAGPEDRLHVIRRFEAGVLSTHLLPAWSDDGFEDGGIGAAPDCADAVIEGFTEMSSVLDSTPGLTGPGGPLDLFSGCRVRVVFQNTGTYQRLLDGSLQPAMLRDGIDRSLGFEILWRPILAFAEPQRHVARCRAEIRSLEDCDIPHFFTHGAGTDLHAGDRLVQPAFFARSGRDQIRVDGARRSADVSVALIRRSLALASDGAPRIDEESAAGASSRPAAVDATDQLRVVDVIADRLARRVERTADGTLSWTVAEPLRADARRHALRPCGPWLYQGAAGIGLFLAACAAIRGVPATAAHEALGSTRALLRLALRHRVRLPIGAGEGLGSIAYALARAGTLLGDEALLADALAAARLITRDAIDREERFDVHGGVGGALIAVLAVADGCGAPADLMELASHAAVRLVALWERAGGAGRAAPLGRARRGGISHGAAGVVLALERAAAATQDARFARAAADVRDWQDSLFDKARGEWRAFGSTSAEPRFWPGWCNGSPGLALAELDAGRMPERALESCLRDRPRLDHVCCGAAGLIDPLLVAARRQDRTELGAAASAIAADLVHRFDRSGGFRLLPGQGPTLDEPGLFRGATGIGYQLLRLAAPDVVPAVTVWE